MFRVWVPVSLSDHTPVQCVVQRLKSAGTLQAVYVLRAYRVDDIKVV